MPHNYKMNIVEKVSKYNKTQKPNEDATKPQTGSSAAAFSETRKNLPIEVKNKLYELHQKYGGMKEATIYNLMKKHEFKYNLVENDLKMLVISKRNFNPQGPSTLSQSVDKKKAAKESFVDQKRVFNKKVNRDGYVNKDRTYNYKNNGYMQRGDKNDDHKDNDDKERSGNYDVQRSYGGSVYKNERYSRPYNDSRTYNKKRPIQNNYTTSTRKSNYSTKPYEYVKKHDTHHDGRRNQSIHEEIEYVKKTEEKPSTLNEQITTQSQPSKPQNSEPVVNEEVNEISEDKEYSQKIGLFAEPRESIDENDAKRALEKLITVIENNMIYYLTTLKEFSSIQKNPDTFIGDKIEQPQIIAPKTHIDSKYKKKAVEVGKEFVNDIDESSTHFRTNKVDLLIKKKFESEEEKFKSTREKKLEKKVNDMAEIISTMQLRINALENTLRNKDDGLNGDVSGFQSNVYCMVPFHLVKNLVMPVSQNGANGYDENFKCYTLNVNDS